MHCNKWKKQYLYICTRHNVFCELIEIHYQNFNQPQTRDYKQKNKKSLETTSIAENKREKNCKIEKAFQNK